MNASRFEIRDRFYLDEKPFKIISGSVYYFRVVPEYWRDRLEKLRLLGANDRAQIFLGRFWEKGPQKRVVPRRQQRTERRPCSQ